MSHLPVELELISGRGARAEHVVIRRAGESRLRVHFRVVAIDLEADEEAPRGPVLGSGGRPDEREERDQGRAVGRAAAPPQQKSQRDRHGGDPRRGAASGAPMAAERATSLVAIVGIEVRGIDGNADHRRRGGGHVPVCVARHHRHRVPRIVLHRAAVVGVIDVGVGDRDCFRNTAVARRALGHHVNLVRRDRFGGVAGRPGQAQMTVASGDRDTRRWRRIGERVLHVHGRLRESAARDPLQTEQVGRRIGGAGGDDGRVVATRGASVGERELIRADGVGPGLRDRLGARDLRRRRRRIARAAALVSQAEQSHRIATAEEVRLQVPARKQLQRLAVAGADEHVRIRAVDGEDDGVRREWRERKGESWGQAHVGPRS